MKTAERLCDLTINDIASMMDCLYRAFDDIQGYIEQGEYELAKDKALKMMLNMEDDVI